MLPLRPALAFLMAMSGGLLAATAHAEAAKPPVIEHLQIGGNGGWDYVTFDPAHQKVYVAHGTAISSLDLKDLSVNPHLADANGAHIALPVDGGEDLLITQGHANLVTLNSAETGAVKASIATDAKPDAAVFEPVTGDVYVMANGGKTVDAVDLKTRTIAARIAVPGAPESAAVDGEGLVFTHLEDANAFVVIDARSQKVKASFAMPDCDEPSGIAFIAKARLILSACKNGKARISNADTGKEVATVPIGTRPDGALYDEQRNLGYIPSGDGKVTVISFDGQPHVVTTIATKPGARTAALDAATGRLFLPTADLGPVDAKTGKPAIIPGSFSVLIVTP